MYEVNGEQESSREVRPQSVEELRKLLRTYGYGGELNEDNAEWIAKTNELFSQLYPVDSDLGPEVAFGIDGRGLFKENTPVMLRVIIEKDDGQICELFETQYQVPEIGKKVSFGYNHYGVPGEKVHAKELPFDAAKRVLTEELGLKIDEGELARLNIVPDTHPGPAYRETISTKYFGIRSKYTIHYYRVILPAVHVKEIYAEWNKDNNSLGSLFQMVPYRGDDLHQTNNEDSNRPLPVRQAGNF